ncbi:MAG: hypothetical protein Q4A69_00650 [Moraxella sp.]|nr:hypothetical protein [Moraxella sp.]
MIGWHFVIVGGLFAFATTLTAKLLIAWRFVFGGVMVLLSFFTPKKQFQIYECHCGVGI